MLDFVCPKCGSGHLRRSHSRGASEKLIRLVGWRAYRCREKSCGWRGLIKKKSLRQAIGKELKGRQSLLLKLILLITLISAGIYLVLSLSNFEPPSDLPKN
jgi:ribosomal protein L40E